MRIVKLQASNFMKLVAVEVSLDGKSIVVSGKNEAGKSSFMSILFATLCGKKAVPPTPINKDCEESAETTVETENYVIKRTYKQDGTTLLTVTNSEGKKAKSPQQLLTQLIGESALVPSFGSLSEKEQYRTLMELVDLDFGDIDTKINKAKAGRSDAKRDKEKAQHEADNITIENGTPNEEVSVAALSQKLTTALEMNAEQENVKRQIDECNTQEERLADVAKVNAEDIKLAQEQLEMAEEMKMKLETELTKLLGDKAKLVESLEPRIDIDTIQAEIAEVAQTNVGVRQKLDKKTRLAEVEEQRGIFAKLGKDVAALGEEKAKRLADAKMPVEGLSVEDGCIIYDGIPLVQVNDSKKDEINILISMALNPKLKVLCLDGNRYDKETLKRVMQSCDEQGYQAIIEKVVDGPEDAVGIYIEEGTVVEKKK